MSDFLTTRLNDIRSRDVLALVTELEVACGISCTAFSEVAFWYFLTQCVYPKGHGTKREPIDAKFLPVDGLLSTPIRKLDGTDIFSLCEELARCNNTSLEFSLGKKLAGFLNASLPKFPPAKKQTVAQRRQDVVRQRRANRG